MMNPALVEGFITSIYVEGVGIMRMILHFQQWLICVNTVVRHWSNAECLNIHSRKEMHDMKALQSREIVFRVENLTKVYHTGEIEVKALNGIDLLLYSGEMAVLQGPSGSGKSTLLNIIGGLDQATHGKIYFNEQELTKFSQRQLTLFRREHVGFVFQFYNLIPSLTAKENVALITEVARNPMPAEEALAMVDLQDRMTHFPAQMSGGEQQRVAIARAVAKQPDVLLCDEPTGSLDSKTGIRVLEALSKINTELGTTTAIITHNAGIQKIAHRVFSFMDGKIASTVENRNRIAPAEVTW